MFALSPSLVEVFRSVSFLSILYIDAIKCCPISHTRVFIPHFLSRGRINYFSGGKKVLTMIIELGKTNNHVISFLKHSFKYTGN